VDDEAESAERAEYDVSTEAAVDEQLRRRAGGEAGRAKSREDVFEGTP